VGSDRRDLDHLDIVYTIQGRYAVGNAGRWLGSFTFGGSGLIERDRWPEYRYRRPDGTEWVYPARTDVSGFPPLVPTVGVAFQYALTPRLAVRTDVQAVFCPYFDSIGVLSSVGISVPIGGRYSR
jgi:hypothetical protein